MKKLFLVAAAIIFAIGCARVSVEGSKTPIKVDISMRLDVYQHVEKDIDAIEGIVTGAKDKKTKPGDDGSFLRPLIGSAYAQEELGPEVTQAALRRKDRADGLYALERKGAVGENKSGLVELRDASQGTGSINQLISSENSDRMIIYKSLAAKNNAPVGDIQKIYAKRLQSDAPSGTPVEALNEATGAYQWRVK